MATYYLFDQGGWYAGETSDAQTPRTTPTAPPNKAQAGEIRPNWTGNEWILLKWYPIPSETPALQPVLSIHSITPDAEHIASTFIDLTNREITCPRGTVLEATGTLNIGGAKATFLTDVFRMPILASDGRERVVLVRITNGDLSIQVPCTESGIWSINQSLANRALPPEKQIEIASFTLYVLEVAP